MTSLERDVYGNPPVGSYLMNLNRRFARRIQTIVGDDASILDIGSGVGRLAEAMKYVMPRATVVCTDIEDYNRSSVPFVVASGDSLLFEDKSFNASTIFYVLHHTDNPEGILREAKRVSKDKVIVQEDTYRNILEKISYELHIRSFQRKHHLSRIGPARKDEDWQRMFEQEGFTVDSMRRVHRLGRPATRIEYVLGIPKQM